MNSGFVLVFIVQKALLRDTGAGPFMAHTVLYFILCCITILYQRIGPKVSKGRRLAGGVSTESGNRKRSGDDRKGLGE